MKRIKINKKLKYTWENIDDISNQFFDNRNNFKLKSIKVLYYISNFLTKEEQDVFFLMCEYNSLRKVAEEMNISYGQVRLILKKIKDNSQLITNKELIKNNIIDNDTIFN